MLNAPTLFKVEGRVLTDDYPLPGCVVRLESASREVRATVSDAEGRYRFHGVPNGEWDLHFTLDGFDDRYKRVVVHDADATAPPVALRMTSIVDTITITFTCGMGLCSNEPPADRYGLPLCRDYEMNTTLIESAERNDRSSIALLRARYDAELTLAERHRLGSALLRKVSDDTAIWKELLSHAEIVLRFPELEPNEPTPEYRQWCAERNLDPGRYWSSALMALEFMGGDARSRDLLRRAIGTGSVPLLRTAILGLAKQRDIESLPMIDAAIAAAKAEQQHLAVVLALFNDERANAIAKKYLAPEDDAAAEPR